MPRMESFEVKSKGESLGFVEVAQYDTVKDALKELSEEDILGRINRTLMEKSMNAFRADKTRTTSPVAKLQRAMAKDPALKDKVNALLGEAGLLD